MKQLILKNKSDAEKVTQLDVAQVPTVQIVTIEPEAATAMLDANLLNRKLSDYRVAAHEETINSGHWMLSNDAVTIDVNGVMVNGQHRLRAAEETGQSIDVILYTGADPQVRDIIDTGMKRSFAQALTMRGLANTANVAAATTLHFLYKNGSLRSNSSRVGVGNVALSHDLLLAWLEANPSIVEGAKVTNTVSYFIPRVKRSAAAAWYAIVHDIDAFEAAAFYERLIRGENLHPGQPELTLRNWLIRQDGSTPRSTYLGVMIKGWNAARDKVEIKSISLRDTEKFPEAK